MPIKEKSNIRLTVDGANIDETFHDKNDAWEKGINQIMQGKRKAVIEEQVTIEKT